MCQARSKDILTDLEPSRSVACSRRCDARWGVALNSFCQFRLSTFNTCLSSLLRIQLHMIAPKAAGAAIPNDNVSHIYKNTKNNF